MLHEEQRYVGLNRPIPFEVSNVQEGSGQQDTGRSAGYANVEYTYHNGFSKTVTVVDRSGMRIEIPPSIDPRVSDFVIRVRITVGREVNLNIDHLLNSSSPASKAMARVIQQGGVSYRHGQISYELDFFVALSDVEDNGGGIYLEDLDRVVSTLNGPHIPLHPHSEVAVRNRLVEDDDAINRVASFGFSLRIIDSLGTFGDRYVNIHGQVYKVPSVRESTLPDGVYLTSSGPVEGEVKYAKPVSKRYSFEEADEGLRLYRTVEAARTYGDEIAQRERELKEWGVSLKEKEQRLRDEKIEREYEFEKLKQQLERERAEEESLRKQEESRAQQRMARLKEEIAELEHKRNVEMLQRKDTYETRSLERKESQEVVKFLPAIVTGALALVVAFSKFSS